MARWVHIFQGETYVLYSAIKKGRSASENARTTQGRQDDLFVEEFEESISLSIHDAGSVFDKVVNAAPNSDDGNP